MGIYDRDYYRASLQKGGFGHFSAWSITTWLIVLNVAVFFADGILQRASPPPELDESYINSPASIDQWMIASMPPIQRWGYFSISTALYAGQAWRFLSFQFLHASAMHLVFNIVGLYFFCPV